MIYLLPLLLLAGCASAIQQARQKEERPNTTTEPTKPDWVSKDMPEHGIYPPSASSCGKGPNFRVFAENQASNVAKAQVAQNKCGSNDAYVVAETLEYFKEVCPDGNFRIHALIKVNEATCK